MRGIFAAVLVSIVIGCSPSANDITRNHFKALGSTDSIFSITTKANCRGSEGKYMTKTFSSFVDDYVLFIQEYGYKSPFNAVIYNLEKGNGLDSMMVKKGTLSKPVIGVLKAHEFHELMMQFDQRYHVTEKGSDTLFFDVDCFRLKAIDPLDLPVTLFFNKKTKLMEGFTQVNPYKKSELIQIHFEDWLTIDGVQVFDKLTILQGEKSKYTFDYDFIIFNDPDFKKLRIE